MKRIFKEILYPEREYRSPAELLADFVREEEVVARFVVLFSVEGSFG